MSDEQVREAAETVRQYKKSRFAFAKVCKEIDAYEALAEAWLAANPEDSETLVDVAWCKTLKGWVTDLTNTLFWKSYGQGSFVIDFNQAAPSLWNRDHKVCDNPTRGDVRRLARALRVELGEQR